MGRPFKQYLTGPRIYSCSNCRSHAADHDEIISKSFQAYIATCHWVNGLATSLSLASQGDKSGVLQCKGSGRHGRAYLFENVVNVSVGPKEDRLLITGLHTVADIYCSECQEVLGWKYERAYEESQKYKEGKYILEKAKVMKENW